MKIRELRIGNYVNYEQTTHVIVTIDSTCGDEIIDSIWIDSKNDDELYCHLIQNTKPIPLTEEWILKFGFTKENISPSNKHSNYFSKWIEDYKYSFSYATFRDDWGFYHSYTDAIKEEDNNKFDFISCNIQYVHQLQNLWYALLGEELTL